MPLYSFLCQRCGHTWQDLQSLSEFDAGELPACPACYERETLRLMGTAGFTMYNHVGDRIVRCAPQTKK